jgi:hypothetical protein
LKSDGNSWPDSLDKGGDMQGNWKVILSVNCHLCSACYVLGTMVSTLHVLTPIYTTLWSAVVFHIV